MTIRVSAFVDGFNLYHAIADTGRHDLKWVNLRQLARQFAPEPSYTLGEVFYFSAYATWKPDAYARHRAFVAALEASAVTCVLGTFKSKPRACRSCSAKWTRHEEKETDVNAALHLLEGALNDRYDLALLVTGDSDLVPAVRMVRQLTSKKVRIISPINRPNSMELLSAAGQTKPRRLQSSHFEQARLPAAVKNAQGSVVALRPAKYNPLP